MKWDDATSYSKGQRGLSGPTAWQTLIEGQRVRISKGHIYHPGIWIMSSEAVGVKEHRLCKAGEPPERAQQLALAQVHVAALRKAELMTKLALACEAHFAPEASQ